VPKGVAFSMYSRVKKVKTGGKTYKYYQIVESRYKNGQSRQKVLLTLGRVDDFDPSFADELAATLSEFTSKTTVLSSLDDCHHLWSKEYGNVYVLEKLWNELKLTDIMGKYLEQHEYEFDVIAAIKAMVFNRAIDANSKRSAHEWMQKDVYLPETEDLQLHHLYRALDFLIEHKKGIEGKIYDNLKDLFNLDVTVVFYDCSLFDMYGETSQLVQYSRKSKTQVLLSFVLSRDGLPISHEVLPGNTSDINTVIEAMQKLKQRYPIGKCIFVGDRGMVSREKLNKLEDMGFDFIVGVKSNQWKEVKEDVLSTRGRYTKVADNLKVKETEVNGYRYIICYNPLQAKRDQETRKSIIEYLKEEIDGLDPESKKAARLYGARFKGRYLRRLKDGTLKIDKMQIREDEKLDGKYILYTSTDSKDLDREEIATTYKRLSNIERSFRSLKSLHDLEPVFHHADRRIKAHVFICILAHLLERLMEKKFAQEDHDIIADRALKHLSRMEITKAELKDKKVLIRTDSQKEVSNIFKSLHYQPPSRVKVL
jgi:transposase